MPSSTTIALRVAAAGLAALVAVLLLGGTASASAPPRLLVTGTGTWTAQDTGPLPGAAMTGTGELVLRRARPAPMAFHGRIRPHDGSLPPPDACEPAVGALAAADARGRRVVLTGEGEVCGVHVQSPISLVTHVYTGSFEVLHGPGGTRGATGFLEIRLGEDGTGSVFATTH
jgi:hypothetical protein